MGLTKSGELMYRSRTSKCQKCLYFLKDPYKCWMHSMIPYRIWENTIGFECNYFKSNINHQCNNCFIFRDYEDKGLFPEKVFGGKYRFNARGERI